MPPRGSSGLHDPSRPQEAAQRRPRGLFLRICFCMLFCIDFKAIFPPNLAPSWPPKSKKIHQKSMPRGLPTTTSFLDGFLIDFGSQLRSPEPSKSWFSLRANHVLSKNRLSKSASIFDAIWVPTWLHFASKIHRNPSKN